MVLPSLRRWWLVPATMAAIMLGGGCGGGPAAGVSPGPGWRAVAGGDLPCRHWRSGKTSASIDDVAALGPADVWTVGTCVVAGTGAGGPGQATTAGVISHWDGRRWRSARLPAGDLAAPVAVYPGVGDNLIAGTADDDMWVASGGLGAGPNANVAFHWDGRHWANQSQGLPSGGGFITIAASAAAGTWAIVRLQDAGPRQNPYGTALVRWDGGRWRQVAVPPLFDTTFPPGPLAAGPGDSVWIGGDTATGTGGYGVPLAARYDGHGWSYHRLPRATSEGGRVTGFVAAGRTTWAFVGYLAVPPHGYQALVPLTGGTPRQLMVPRGKLLDQIYATAGDAHGDVYLLRLLVNRGLVIQRWDGHAWHIDQFAVPRHPYAYQGDGCAPPGSAYGKPGGRLYGLDISAIAAAPGTTVVWAAGSFGRGGAALYPDCAQPTTQPIIEVDGLAPQQ